MRINTVKQKLAAGQPAVGTWLSLASPLAAEYMAHLGWDWLVVDTEHSPIGFETTLQLLPGHLHHRHHADGARGLERPRA